MKRTAANEEEYRASWQYHISQLALLALQSDQQYKEFKQITDTLMTWLDIAIKRRNEEQDNGK